MKINLIIRARNLYRIYRPTLVNFIQRHSPLVTTFIGSNLRPFIFLSIASITGYTVYVTPDSQVILDQLGINSSSRLPLCIVLNNFLFVGFIYGSSNPGPYLLFLRRIFIPLVVTTTSSYVVLIGYGVAVESGLNYSLPFLAAFEQWYRGVICLTGNERLIVTGLLKLYGLQHIQESLCLQGPFGRFYSSQLLIHAYFAHIPFNVIDYILSFIPGGTRIVSICLLGFDYVRVIVNYLGLFYWADLNYLPNIQQVPIIWMPYIPFEFHIDWKESFLADVSHLYNFISMLEYSHAFGYDDILILSEDNNTNGSPSESQDYGSPPEK